MPEQTHLHVLIPAVTGAVISAALCAVITALALTAAWTRHTGRRAGALDALALLLHRARRPGGPISRHVRRGGRRT